MRLCLELNTGAVQLELLYWKFIGNYLLLCIQRTYQIFHVAKYWLVPGVDLSVISLSN